MAAMAGFSGKVRKPKAAAPKLGKRVSRKVVVAPQPAASELSEPPSDDGDGDGDEDFGGDEADMDEEVVGASDATTPLGVMPDLQAGRPAHGANPSWLELSLTCVVAVVSTLPYTCNASTN